MKTRAVDDIGPLILIEGVSHCYRRGGVLLSVLCDVSLRIDRGETCVIQGASGSGKSTLLHILGLLDRPADGRFHFAGRDIMATDSDNLAEIRNREIGFVFQAFNLLPRLTALDNVALPLLYRGVSRRFARELAMTQLQRMGLAERAMHRPADLSGGQLQRVAIARALVGEPSVLLADEPTGNLDSTTAKDILALLLELNSVAAVTLVMVTHDTSLAALFERQIEVRDGALWEVPRRKGSANG